MHRKAIDYIKEWYSRSTRKPLIIRGARQVGKTTTVQLVAEQLGVELIYVNMEDQHAFISELSRNDPKAVFELIALDQGKTSLDPEKTLFFFLMKHKSNLRSFRSYVIAMKKHPSTVSF